MEHESLLLKQRLETFEAQMKEKEERYGKEHANYGN